MKELLPYNFFTNKGKLLITKEDISYLLEDIIIDYELLLTEDCLKINVPTIIKKRNNPTWITFVVSKFTKKEAFGFTVEYGEAIVDFLDRLFRMFVDKKGTYEKSYEEMETYLNFYALDRIIGLQKKILLIEKLKKNNNE